MKERADQNQCVRWSLLYSILVISVLTPQTANALLEAFSRVSEAVRLVQVRVVGGRDVGVLGVVACDGCWVAVVEHALAFLVLVIFPQNGGVLHFNGAVVVDSVGAEGAVEGEGIALAIDVVWVVVL